MFAEERDMIIMIRGFLDCKYVTLPSGLPGDFLARRQRGGAAARGATTGGNSYALALSYFIFAKLAKSGKSPGSPQTASRPR